MKFLVIILLAMSFNLSAKAQSHEPETPGKAGPEVEEMTLVKETDKKLHVEESSLKKKQSSKKTKKTKTKTDH